jgi:hypothetical protein
MIGKPSDVHNGNGARFACRAAFAATPGDARAGRAIAPVHDGDCNVFKPHCILCNGEAPGGRAAAASRVTV